jgi:hypothetical protein
VEEPLAVRSGSGSDGSGSDGSGSDGSGSRAPLASPEAAAAHLAALAALRAATGSGGSTSSSDSDSRGFLVAMPVALDESLAQGLAHHPALLQVALRGGQVAALVLKPSVLGPIAALRLGNLCAAPPFSATGPEAAGGPCAAAVVSAAFDGAVGLAHHSLLAAALGPAAAGPAARTTTTAAAAAAGPSAAHGLGTYRVFAPAPGNAAAQFRAAAVADDGRGHIDPLRCEELLRAAAASDS